MPKKVYVAMAADLIHPGHLNVIKHAQALGEVTVGILSDKAVSAFHRLPFLTFEQRKLIVENIKGVDKVIRQETLDYTENLLALKPDYVVHGDDWKEGPQRETRDRVIEVLKQWQGELVEVPYTRSISSLTLNEQLKAIGTTPGSRMERFRRLLTAKCPVKLMEAHNGLTAHIIENLSVDTDQAHLEFDGIWLSSLTDSAAKGKPDIEYVDKTSRLATINDILESTTKPIVFDGDSGGLTEHFVFTVKSLERLGVSAVVIEDKVGLKRNSLLDDGPVEAVQDDIPSFCYKISQGKKKQITKEFMIIARVESLVLNKPMEDAFTRAEAYLGAGADGIMIHSKSKDGKEILEFCRRFRAAGHAQPLVVVPSTYNAVPDHELVKAGATIIIYANHMLRSAYPSMMAAARGILLDGCSKNVEKDLMPVSELVNLFPGG
ncbi:MAG: phosphoenolpyruvate mutase [Cyanobacteria bacterium SZAS TMP-1]|nr:phosphoenolpyruvate mutase [Cyanobacteria bacterium SZAS TMP-1]